MAGSNPDMLIEFVCSLFNDAVSKQNVQVREDEMGRACSTHGVGSKRNAYRILMGKGEGKRPL
jgi:hypothetical protein